VIRFIQWMFVTLLCLFATQARANDLAPDELVKNTTQEVISVIKQDKDIQAGDRAKIYALVEEKVLTHFDFRRMSQLAMGKNWRQATPEQQEALIKEFRSLLVRTYAVSLSQYRDQKIEIKPTKLEPDAKDATVKSVFLQNGREPVTVDYVMYKLPAGWKVFNITIEGVSLVENYRSTFNEQVRKSGVDGLIKTLAERNKSAEATKN
jgi:phospholipid transport system substrate-binding protein